MYVGNPYNEMIGLFGHESIEKYDWLEMTENEIINKRMK